MSEVRLKLTSLEWALMMQESSGRPVACRVDAVWRSRLVAQGLKDAELEFQCRAWGLWQLPGRALRELGYQGTGEDFCADVALQRSFMRRKWRRDTDPRDPMWWNIEHWNLDPLGDARRRAPSSYYQGVTAWLRSNAVRGKRLEIFFPKAA